MTRPRAFALWFVTVLLLAVASSQNWGLLEVSEDAGGGVLQVNGFLAFPVLGALIVLQVLASLCGLLVAPKVARYLSVGLIPIMVWNVFDVLQNSATQTQLSLLKLLASKTGVLEAQSSSGLVVSSSTSSGSGFYLLAVALNLLVLVLISFMPMRSIHSRKLKSKTDVPEDLWSKQS